MITIKDKKDCCGCSACYSVCPKSCISMVEDMEGCLYPFVEDTSCIDCGLCEKVCPVLNQQGRRHPIEVWAAKSRNEGQRLQSSSGGVFSLIAEWVIKQGGVVFGARFNENWDVVHDWTDTKDGLSPFRGSKYVQSNMGDCFKQAKSFLDEGRWVLFSGTACQIVGLKGFLRKDYERLLTIDVICHGVPVPYAWREYLKEITSRPVKEGERRNTVLPSLKGKSVITDISFRDKTDGWQKYGFVLHKKSAVEADSNSVSSSIETIREPFYGNPFMKGFLANLYLRPSCYSCPSKCGKCGSDITIGDYWGIDNFHPEFNDDKGVSAILFYSGKGRHIFGQLDLEKSQSKYESVLSGNSALENAAKEHKNRSRFFSGNITFQESLRICMKQSIVKILCNRIVRIVSTVIRHYLLKKQN